MSTIASSPLPLRVPRPAVILPEHGAYDEARAAWNLVADQRPAGVVRATTVREVQDAIVFARANGLQVAPQTTGHNGSALPSLERALLVKTDLRPRVEIDPVARSARVHAGAEWEDVVRAAQAHGLAAMHGSSPNVGVVGYLLGAGLSFYARKHGVGVNHVTAIEVVTADGVHRRVDAHDEPDLFWALRGGGGNFGVVTAIEFGLFDYAEVFAGSTFWPVAQAPEILQAWRTWTETAPDSVTTSARILHLPPLPEVDAPLRDVPVIGIDGIVLPDCPDAAALLAPWRSLGTPILDDWAHVPPIDVMRMHRDPEPPVPVLSTHALLGPMGPDGIDAFVASFGADSGSPLVIAELRQLGAALAAPPAGAGARGHLDGSFALFAAGLPLPPETAPAIEAHLELARASMSRWDTGRVYLNFNERSGSAENAYLPAHYARLQGLRAAWDPEERFIGSHRIAGTAG